MQLFDTHPPPKLNVSLHSSESSCSAFSPQTLHAIFDANNAQRDFEKAVLEREAARFFEQEF